MDGENELVEEHFFELEEQNSDSEDESLFEPEEQNMDGEDESLFEEQTSYCKEFVSDLTDFVQNNHDVELKCTDGIVNGNKLLLASRSAYFKALFNFENQKSQNEKKSVDLSQFNSNLVQVVVDTLIHLDHGKIASVNSLKLLEVSNYLQMQALTLVASKRVAKDLDVDNVMDIYGIAKNFNNFFLRNCCTDLVSQHIFEVYNQKRLTELDEEEIDRVIEAQQTAMSCKLEEFVRFVKNFYQLTRDLDRIEAFKSFVILEHHRDWIYFALTFDKSILKLGQSEDIELTNEMKIDLDSELGHFLPPLCPRPIRKIDWKMNVSMHYWTHKYGNFSDYDLVYGPDWKIEGDFQKIKFYKMPHGEESGFFICGLEITLKDGSVHCVGYTGSPHVEVFDLEQMELLRLGICVSEASQFILAIQVNCFSDGPKGFFVPRDQYHLPFERQGEEAELLEDRNGMCWFGFIDQRLHRKYFKEIYSKGYSFSGIKGKTVMVGDQADQPIICELQVKYSKDSLNPREPEYENHEAEFYGFQHISLPGAIGPLFPPTMSINHGLPFCYNTLLQDVYLAHSIDMMAFNAAGGF